MEGEKIPLDKSNPDSIYNWLALKISSPAFRNVIKDFIDDNCSLFIDVEENTFQQGQLFNEFTQLVENILNDVLVEGGLTQEQFLAAAEKGLQDQKYKKYFDQLLNFTEYNYFKKIMTKRNYQIIKKIEEQIAQQNEEKQKKAQEEIEKKIKNESKSKTDREKEEEKQRVLLNQLLNQEEEEDLQKAIQKSLELEEEKRKIAIIEEEELKRALKQSLLDSVKPQTKNDEKKEKGEKKPEPEPEPKQEKKPEPEPKKEEKKPEPKKEEFTIEKNDMFNFEKQENPKKENPQISNNKNSMNIISNSTNFQFSGNMPKEQPKPNKPSNIISPSQGFDFQIESKKNDFGISSMAPTTFSNSTQSQNPKPNPYARPSPSQSQAPNLKIENRHIKQDLIDDEPENKNNDKKYTNDTPSNEKKEEKKQNKNDNKNSINLLQFEDNTKEENIVMAKQIKAEKASDIIKNTLNNNRIKEDNDDGGLLIDDEEEDANNYRPNGPKTNTFIDKNKDINLGKVRLGKDGGNFLNNFRDMKSYERGGIEKMENKLKGEQYKSVVTNENDEDDYQKKLREVEKEKQEKLKEYREYLLKMKKEKRENKAKEVLSPEELAKLESKKRLAEQLKAKRK